MKSVKNVCHIVYMNEHEIMRQFMTLSVPTTHEYEWTRSKLLIYWRRLFIEPIEVVFSL